MPAGLDTRLHLELYDSGPQAYRSTNLQPVSVSGSLRLLPHASARTNLQCRLKNSKEYVRVI